MLITLTVVVGRCYGPGRCCGRCCSLVVVVVVVVAAAWLHS